MKLQYKINLAILVAFMLISMIFISIELPFQKQRFQTIMEKVKILLKTLVERDREHLANEIYESRLTVFNIKDRLKSAEIRLKQMRETPGIVCISVYDNTGRLLIYDGIYPDSHNLDAAETESASKGTRIRQEIWHRIPALSYLEEIRIIEERIGFIRIYYSLADIEQEEHRSHLILWSLLISILIIMLAVINLILSKTIIHPIKYLRDAMQHIRKGELGGQVEVITNDEVGELSQTFNQMSVELAKAMENRRQAEESLQKLNESLEQRVNERTEELTGANIEITSLNSQLKESLIRSEKMAMLGQIIAGVAHEIKTPLGAIRASVDNILDSLPQILERLPRVFQFLSEDLQKNFFSLLERTAHRDVQLSAKEDRKLKRKLCGMLEDQGIANADDIADSLADMGVYDNTDMFLPLFRHPENRLILQSAYNISALQRNSLNISVAANRTAKIVLALKTYAHHDHTETLISTDLAENIETVLTLYHNQLKYGIEVIRNYEPLQRILCYPDELNQVWTNLIHNAIQAMSGSGTLEIDLYSDRADGRDYAVVRFTDSGKGIPDEIKQRIFEPFFTTKAAGEGSGLGLHIVKKIIDKHNGKIEVESKPGRTMFSVMIPV